MPVNQLFGTTIDLLGKTLDLRARRQVLISANIANAETPGYTPTDLSFEDQLKNALQSERQGKTPGNPRFIPVRGAAQAIDKVEGEVVETPDTTASPDGNGVQMESQMQKMAENQIMYNATVQLLNSEFDWLKLAIKGN